MLTGQPSGGSSLQNKGFMTQVSNADDDKNIHTHFLSLSSTGNLFDF